MEAAGSQERSIRDSKPFLEALVDDFRRAVDGEAGGRREQLENLVVYFSAALSDPRVADCTQAEADAARETWGIKSRC